MNNVSYMSIPQQLQMISGNQRLMGNSTVANAMALRDKKDINGLIDLYKNTCQTTGNQPDPRIMNYR